MGYVKWTHPLKKVKKQEKKEGSISPGKIVAAAEWVEERKEGNKNGEKV